jgi:hypothetical protein
MFHRALVPTTILICALLAPLLAACAGSPPAGLPTPRPPVPTAGDATTTALAPTATVDPTRLPPTSDSTTAAPVTPLPTAAPDAPFSPERVDTLQFGVVTHLYYTDRARVLTLTKTAGFEWVRQQIHWKDIESARGVYYWNELDNIVADVDRNHVKLLLNMVQSPDFYNPTNGLPDDPRALGNFVEALVRRYGDKIGALEIWNEPNLAAENGGRVTANDPAHYAEILIECYQRAKAIAPSIIVLAAAPSSTGVRDERIALPDAEYLEAFYTYRGGIVRHYFDAQAVHPGAAANPPETLYPQNPSVIEGCEPSPNHCWNDDPTHYFRHIEDIRALMVSHGLGDRQIWITEYGWATQNDTPNFEFGRFTSFEQQADYIARAITMVYQQYRDEDGKPWVGAMFLWNMNFAVLWGAQGDPLNEQASFSLLNPDWSPRPAFIMLQGLHMRLKDERGS